MRRLPLLDSRPPGACALVLLSGGLDSVAAMHWAREEHAEVAAISFDYGQPARDGEVTAAQRITRRRGVPHTLLALGEAVRGLQAIAPPDPGAVEGVSRANLPARNLILLSVAAAHAARLWPGRRVWLIVGATLDDVATFPDCREDFFEAARYAVSFALSGVAAVSIQAPWVKVRKAAVLAWCAPRPDALEDVRESVSCYRGTRCGTCDACTLRARAFEAEGLADGAWLPTMTGGDPGRDRALRGR